MEIKCGLPESYRALSQRLCIRRGYSRIYIVVWVRFESLRQMRCFLTSVNVAAPTVCQDKCFKRLNDEMFPKGGRRYPGEDKLAVQEAPKFQVSHCTLILWTPENEISK